MLFSESFGLSFLSFLCHLCCYVGCRFFCHVFLFFLLFGELCYPTNCRKWRKSEKFDESSWGRTSIFHHVSSCFLRWGGETWKKGVFFWEITTKLSETHTKKKQEDDNKNMTSEKKWQTKWQRKWQKKNWQDNNLKHTQRMAARIF